MPELRINLWIAMLKKSGFLSAILIPAMVVIGFYGGGWWNFLAVLFVFLVIPVADAITGLDTNNHDAEVKDHVAADQYYRLVTYLWVVIQFVFLFWTIFIISAPLPAAVYIGLLIGTGMVTGGIGITVAHELGHKNNKTEQTLSQLLLMTVCYMHFFIEHNRGHHVHVATPEDPATARKGENFYHFFFRSVLHGWLHAWKIENESLRRRNLKIISSKNKMILFSVLPLLFCALLTYAGYLLNPEMKLWIIPAFFFGQSIIGFGLLELVNYVENYGIVRKKLPSGGYERVNPLHSWNTAYLISNLFLFQLQRHSDHHTYASKRYQVLDHFDESPQLPYGYPTMVLMALVPPLWFSVMDKKLEDWQKASAVLS
jgi:alkane 1-monooxygenase